MNTSHSHRTNIELGPGERIIWQGQPVQGFRLAPQDTFALPFAAFWLFIVVMIFGSVLTTESADIDPLLYLIIPVFLLAGLHMLVGRFIVDRFARRRTHFYLTTERAVIESGLMSTSQRTVNLSAVPEIRIHERKDGRGTVQFGSPSLSMGMLPPSWPGASQFLPPAFDDIEEAQQVYRLALSTQRNLRTRNAATA